MSRRKQAPEDGFDLASLSPRETGFPFVVFILQNLGVIPDARVEVACSVRVRRSETVKVAIRPAVHIMRGHLDAHELALPTRWIDLNRDAPVKRVSPSPAFHRPHCRRP